MENLERVLECVGKENGIVGVHAEKHEIVLRETESLISQGKVSTPFFPMSRPKMAEVEAVEEVIRLARKTSTPLYIFHLTSQSGLEKITEAKSEGALVFAETCPHYLMFTQEIYSKNMSEDKQLILVGANAFKDGLYDIAEKQFSHFLNIYPTHDKVFEATLKYVRPGIKEYEILSEFQRVAKDMGSESQAGFLYSAPEGTSAMNVPTRLLSHEMKRGDQLNILIEVSGPGGFWAEIARAICIGSASHHLKDLTQISFELQEEMAKLMQQKRSPFDFRGLNLVRTAEESKAINHIKGTVIIIAGSGMCTGGRIKHHLVNNISRRESTILFPGFQAVETLGRQIVDGAREVRILGQMYPVQAKIVQMNGFSAHADRNELFRWLSGLKRPPRHLFVTHGEPDAAKYFANFLKQKKGGRYQCPTTRMKSF
jgi:hypothetical protein